MTAFDEWIGSPLEPDAGWLAGVALLGRPLLPELAGQVGTRLGFPGEPGLRQVAHLEPLPQPSPATAPGPLLGPLSLSSLRQYVHLQDPE
ncbi:hypothetical protein ACWD7F_24755 [Streptomyces sp. NPDC005122]